MKMTLSALVLAMVSGLSFGSYAACGGGGYSPAPRITSRGSDTDSKLDELRRDVDKAQRKLNQCVGECDKERRKLDEAERKLAKRSAEVSGR